MKKTLLIGTLTVMALASCKKDYTCECDHEYWGDYEYTILESTQKAAKEYCEGPKGLGEIGDEDGDNSYDPYDCELSTFKD